LDLQGAGMKQSKTRWVAAIILIAIGVIALLENFGVIQHHAIRDILRSVLKWWPILLILLGVSLLFRGKN
jgi:hypothetical protein